MNEFAARISRVRMKSGGADVVVIDGSPLVGEYIAIRGDMQNAVRQIIANAEEIGGYVMIAFETDGSHHICHRLDDDCPIPRTLLPAYVTEIVRRTCIGQYDAEAKFHELFEWQE